MVQRRPRVDPGRRIATEERRGHLSHALPREQAIPVVLVDERQASSRTTASFTGGSPAYPEPCDSSTPAIILLMTVPPHGSRKDRPYGRTTHWPSGRDHAPTRGTTEGSYPASSSTAKICFGAVGPDLRAGGPVDEAGQLPSSASRPELRSCASRSPGGISSPRRARRSPGRLSAAGKSQRALRDSPDAQPAGAGDDRDRPAIRRSDDQWDA